MDRSNPNPNPSNSPERRVFELGKNNAVEYLGLGPWIKLDRDMSTYVRDARAVVRRGELNTMEVIEHMRVISDRVAQQGWSQLQGIYDRAERRPVDISVIHLVNTIMTAEQRLIWPVLCEFGRRNRQAESARKDIAADMYGYCGEQLDTLYAHPENDSFNYSDAHRVGAITELTALALLNRPRSGNRLTLLGTPHEDRQGVDLVHYVYDDTGLHSHHIQVKTSPHTAFSGANITLLNAQDLGNMDRNGRMTYNTTRAIIAELQGDHNADVASEYLDKVQQLPKLRDIMNS